MFGYTDPLVEYPCTYTISSAGFTELMRMVMIRGYGLTNIIADILKKDPETVNKCNNKGWSALMIACANSDKYDSVVIVKMLIEAGADVNLRENRGYTALMLATHYCSSHRNTLEIIQMLINAGANVDAQTNKEWTALMIAANNGSENIVEILVKSKAMLDIQNEHGQTALMICNIHNLCNARYVSRILITAGADLNILDNEGNNVASIIKNRDCVFKAIMENEAKLEFIKIHKKYTYKFVLSMIPQQKDIIKFHPDNIGSKITSLNFTLKNGDADEIYEKLCSTNSPIIDYLNIKNPKDLIIKVAQYLDQ